MKQEVTMNCPYCNAFLTTHVQRCPECRSLLPSRESMLVKNPNRRALSAKERDEILRTLHWDSEVPLAGCLLADAQLESAIAKSKNYNSIGDLYEALHTELTASGIVISKADLRLLLSFMAADRILRFPDTDDAQLTRLFRYINLFFSGLDVQAGTVPDALSQSSRLFGDACVYAEPEGIGESYYRDTVFLTNAYMAAAVQAPLVQVVCNMSAERYVVTGLLSAYAALPEAMTVIDKVPTADIALLPRFWFLFEDGYYLPRNMWFAFSGNALAHDSSGNGTNAYRPEIRIRFSFTGEEDPSVPGIQDRQRFTYDDFFRLCRLSRETRYFPETVFRRLDALDAFMKETCALSCIDNVLWRRMEVFSSVYLSMCGEESEALDNMLAAYLLPRIPKTDTVIFAEAFMRIFNGMELPHCHKTLSLEA